MKKLFLGFLALCFFGTTAIAGDNVMGDDSSAQKEEIKGDSSGA